MNTSIVALIKEGKKTLSIDVEPGLDLKEVRKAIVNLLEYEYALDIKINKLPMCVLPYAFHLFDNSKKGKHKNAECFSCKFNFFCNGFYEDSYVSRVRDLPDEVAIEVTSNCNLRCKHCLNNYSYPVKERENIVQPSLKQLFRLLEKIKELGVDYVKFTGGEPFMRGDIEKLFEKAKALGLSISLNTNGTLIKEKQASLIKRYVRNVLIPFSADDAKVTGLKEAYERKLEAVKLLKGIPIIRGGIVLTDSNVKNLEYFYKLAERIRLSWLDFFRQITTKEDKSLKQAIIKIRKLNMKYKRSYKISNSVPLCIKQARKVAFGGLLDDGFERINIDVFGNAKPNYYWPGNFGNAYTETLFAIWENMRGLRELGDLPKECMNCSVKTRCRGGSRSIARLVSAKANSIDPLIRKA